MAKRPSTTRVAVALPEESAPEHWLRNLRLSGFTVLMLGIVVLAVIVLAPNLRIFFEQRQQIAALEQQVDEKQDSVISLEGELARWDDPAYIESQARERLLFVYPGEYSYLVIGDAEVARTSDGAPISDQIHTTQVDWVRSVLQSVFTAGLTDAAPTELLAPGTGGTP
ncbi:MAG: septum formation initiator family protein [Salinibacterium sp.]|nr:septum formation initiator family protein [Salinibacterium sp.]